MMRATILCALLVGAGCLSQPLREPDLKHCEEHDRWRQWVLSEHPDYVQTRRGQKKGLTITMDVKIGNASGHKCILELWNTHLHNKEIYDANKPTFSGEAQKAGSWGFLGAILGAWLRGGL